MLNRRDLLRGTGATGASLMFAHAFGGCASEDGSLPPEGMDPSQASNPSEAPDSASGSPPAPDPLPVDPEGRWWLSGNYAPVFDELDAFDLEVEGALPPELDGLFLRNGANPASGESEHWFVGDGMLHGVRLQGGRALSYRNRFIRTQWYLEGGGESVAANTANTSIQAHAGKLLAMFESGLPHLILPEDLGTVGEYDFGGALQGPMSAHPKFDPVTGEMFFIGYSPFPPYVTYHVVDANGVLTRSIEVEMGHAPMMHDMQVSESYAVLYDLPIHFDIAGIQSGNPFRWMEDLPGRMGLLPRDGSSSVAQWFDVDPCYMFHSFNAYETAEGRVVLEGCRLPDLWTDPSGAEHAPTPWRWELDPSTGLASEGQLHDGAGDFPQVDPRVACRAHQIDYSLSFAPGRRVGAAPDGVRKFDRRSGQLQTWSTGPALQPDEAVFVPVGDAEDAGYLLSMVFDATTNNSFVAVIDATDVQSGPVARVHMPRRVPFGFHGTWLPMG